MKLSTRYWGALVTLLYAAVLLLLVIPFAVWIGGGMDEESSFEVSAAFELFSEMGFEESAWSWAWIGLLVATQACLFALGVDRTHRRMRPRRRLAVSIVAIVLATGLLGLGAFTAVIAVVWGDNVPDSLLWPYIVVWPVVAIVFYSYRVGISKHLDRLLNWVIAGSVAELLISVPCHIIVRQRDTCCAQGISAIGLATGIAVMLTTLGPGVWFLYQKKLDSYDRQPPTGNQPLV